MYWKNQRAGSTSSSSGATGPAQRATTEERRASLEGRMEEVSEEGRGVSPRRLHQDAYRLLRDYEEASAIPVQRTVALPVRAFDALQDLKRSEGIHSNAEAVSYALALADALAAYRAYTEAVARGQQGRAHHA
ncbi:hypothetical protein [Halorhodospira neutriphila]|uniref:Uncharacterized protein n=1 Tax=Halorhodospira neutriphila TaxID=168379 RepID=A0ABS1E595_9GAMM|nr:hypothetical protein [Halorhodospira neutriphila]MBK1726364.1 hypothetical protein [Halorhodospira neutriphila]